MKDEEKRYYWDFYMRNYNCLTLYLLQKEKEKLNGKELTDMLKVKATALDRLIEYRIKIERGV